MLDQATIAGLAFCVHTASSGLDVFSIVQSLGLTVVLTDDLPAGVRGILMGRVIYARRSKGWGDVLLAILHECAHRILAQTSHTHADVWALTLQLCRPRGLPDFRLAGVNDCDQVPGWVLSLG